MCFGTSLRLSEAYGFAASPVPGFMNVLGKPLFCGLKMGFYEPDQEPLQTILTSPLPVAGAGTDHFIHSRLVC